MFTASVSYSSTGKPGKSSMVCDYMDDHRRDKVVKAMQRNSLPDIRKMMKHGLNMNAFYRFEHDSEKMTLLQYAAREGHVAMATELLKSKCDVEKATQFDEMTALHFASACRSPETAAAVVAQLLLDHGADVNCANYCGRTPALLASERGDARLLRLLLRAGADVSARSSEEVLPPVIYQIVESVNVSARLHAELWDAFRDNDALLQACREQHESVVATLLAHGCRVDVANDNGNTPLHVACKSYSRGIYSERATRAAHLAGSPAIVRLLVAAGAPLDAANDRDATPASRAVDGLLELSVSCLPAGVTADETRRLLEVLATLVSAGCDVRHAYVFDDDAGTRGTLLDALLGLAPPRDCSAAQTAHAHCVALLLAAGATLSHRQVRDAIDAPRSAHLLRILLRHPVDSPAALTQLATVAVRTAVRKPLSLTLPRLNLPHAIRSYLNLQVGD